MCLLGLLVCVLGAVCVSVGVVACVCCGGCVLVVLLCVAAVLFVVGDGVVCGCCGVCVCCCC